MSMVSKTKKPRGHLLLPPTMKDFGSCFSEHAVRVSDSSCSGSSSSSRSVLGGSSSSNSYPSVKSAVSCLYRTKLSTQKDLLINITWSKTLSIAISSSSRKAMTNWVLREKAGKMSFSSGSSIVGLYWDLSNASYSSSPEPANGFYVIVVVDKELALSIGDMSVDFVTKVLKERRASAITTTTTEFRVVSRREQVVGRLSFSTKVRFCSGGGEHDITIRCIGDSWNAAGTHSELQVCVDKKRVAHVTRLEYNFRGNQTLFVDGSPVDLMWDVHDWWFPSAGGGVGVGVGGYAVFLFRTRSRLESRLWLEEEVLCKEQGVSSGFSFLIEAFKSPMRSN